MTLHHSQGAFLLSASIMAGFFDNSFVNCSCFYGGSLALIDIQYVIMKNLNFFNSCAENDGGHMYLSSIINIDLINITLKQSLAFFGGAIYCFKIHRLWFLNLNISFSFSKSNGGIFFNDVKEIVILKSFFNENKALGKGSVFFSFNSLLTISEASIFNSDATQAGGVGYFTAQSYLDFEYIRLENSSSYSGGALFLNDIVEGKFNYLTVQNSCSDFNGAIIFIDIALNLTMNNIYLYKSITKNSGIFYIKCESEYSEIVMNNFTVEKTFAEKGSFIYFLSNAKLNLSKVNLIEISAPSIILWAFFPNFAKIVNLLILKTFGDENLIEIKGFDTEIEKLIVSQTNHKMSFFFLQNSNSFLRDLLFLNNNNTQYAFECSSSSLTIERFIINNYQNNNKTFYFSFLNSEKSNVRLINGTIRWLFSFFGQIILSQTTNLYLENLFFLNNEPLQTIFGNDITLKLQNCIFLNNSLFSLIIEVFFIENGLPNEVSVWNTSFEVSSELGVKLSGSPFKTSIDFTNFTGSAKNSITKSGLFLQNCEVLNINNSSFQEFTKNSLFVEMDSLNLKDVFSFNIKNSLFIKNNGTIGSAILIKGLTKAYLLNCSFICNVAFSNIGIAPCVAFLKSFNSNTSKIYFIDSNFINNTSEFIAPTVYSEIPVNSIRNSFINNQDLANFTEFFFALNMTIDFF